MQQPSFDSWTIIFLFASVQGFFLTIVLSLHMQGNRKANKMLASLICLFSITLLYYVTYWTGYAAKYAWVNNWVDAIPFLFGPFAYLYLRLLDEKKLPSKYSFHFIPFAVHFIFSIPFIIRNIFGKIEFFSKYFFGNGDTINYILYFLLACQCLSLIVYGILMILWVRKDSGKITEYALEGEYIKHRWMKRLVFFYCGFSVSVLSYWMLVITHLLKTEFDYTISFTMSAFIYMTGYMGFRQPLIFNEVPEFAKLDRIYGSLQIEKAVLSEKYRNSSLKTGQAQLLKEQLLLMMQQEKPFLNNNLKIQHLASALKVSSHHLSQVINDMLGLKYSDFINQYRVDEAKKLLSDPAYEAKILSIAFDVGYNNKATFNAAFKKNTGMSPSEYRYQVSKEAIA